MASTIWHLQYGVLIVLGKGRMISRHQQASIDIEKMS